MSSKKPISLEIYTLAVLIFVWVGVWGAWIGHKTVALTQNAIDLAEWSDYLTDVRFGELAGTPDRLRLAVGLAMVVLALGAGAVSNGWIRWGIRLLAAVPVVVMLPPYPFLLDLWWSDSYGVRFIVAVLALVGIAANVIVDRLPGLVRRISIIVLSVLGVGLGMWAFFVLRSPFEAHYASSITPGWGALLFWVGLVLASAFQIVATYAGK